jgi:hypothetical protein
MKLRTVIIMWAIGSYYSFPFGNVESTLFKNTPIASAETVMHYAMFSIFQLYLILAVIKHLKTNKHKQTTN